MERNLFLHAGEVTGRLVEVEQIEAAALEKTNEAVILLVKRATGDEEVSARGNLRGVILCHGLPHLSHLGRASAPGSCKLLVIFTVQP